MPLLPSPTTTQTGSFFFSGERRENISALAELDESFVKPLRPLEQGVERKALLRVQNLPTPRSSATRIRRVEGTRSAPAQQRNQTSAA
mmetsp:Transcript_6430/g.20232  ORF Transcript_6430/g.20232 Transcript_6430/m.20232 type:complete len:88 (+) Transcript_6430:932-1195(+)